MRKVLFTSAISICAASPVTLAQASDLSVSTSIDYVTDYVFRGVSLADSAIQPGVELSKGHFYVGGWASTAIGNTSILAGDELDLYAGYSFKISDTINTDIGVTYYHYPQSGSLFQTKDGTAGTYELFTSLFFDTQLSPSASVYYDLTLKSLTLEGSVGHSFELHKNSSLDLGLSAGYVDGDGFSYEYGQARVSIAHALTDDVSAYISANYALSSEDTLNYKTMLENNFVGDDNLLFFGAGISAGF